MRNDEFYYHLCGILLTRSPQYIHRGTFVKRDLILLALAIILAAGMLAGCGSLPNGRGWGEDATLCPPWERVKKAAIRAAADPATWAPAAAALILQIDDMDEDLSDWAADNTPVFGSQGSADDASDYLRDAAIAAYGTTAILTPSGEKAETWLVNKAKGVGIGVGSILLTYGVTKGLKDAVNRTRPNGTGRDSFPSAHASAASASAALASRNLDYLSVTGWRKTALRAGFLALPYATGWARVEADQHYPSDVLAGIALGNFISAFFNDAFIGEESARWATFGIEPSKGGLTMKVSLTF